MSDLKLFKGLIEENDPRRPYFQNYWARGKHLGEAIDLMLEAAEENLMKHAVCREADPVDSVPKDLADQKDQRVFWADTCYEFPPEPSLVLPYGVVCARGEEGHDGSEIRRAYRVRRHGGLVTIEANLDANDVNKAYFSLLWEFKTFQTFWYKLHSHWAETEDQGATVGDAFYSNEDLDTPEKIRAHLMANEADSLRNGFCSLTVYFPDGATNVTLSDHKKIVVTTESAKQADIAIKFFTKLMLQKPRKFITIDEKMHHWHFRPIESRTRQELVSWVGKCGFKKWEK